MTAGDQNNEQHPHPPTLPDRPTTSSTEGTNADSRGVNAIAGGSNSAEPGTFQTLPKFLRNRANRPR
jgi:hypothetical protein